MAMDLWQSDLFSGLPWCAHGFTERSGGRSSEPFASLNLGLHVDDDAGKVLQNRSVAAAGLGFALDDLICAEQVHGGLVSGVGTSERGRGATQLTDGIGSVDALVTSSPGVLLTLFFADCAPVFLADTRREVVATAHAGWRGVVANVVENTVATMIREFGSEPEDLVAAVGPCIGPCCFEVGSEVAAHFDPRFVSRESAQAKPYVDLKGVIAQRLIAAGLSRESIASATECTSCNSGKYFSHRRDHGRTGRMAAMIGIRPQ